LAAEAGEIDATHPLPDGPWIFSRDTLAASAAQAIVQRARHNPRYPTGSHPDQKSLYPSATYRAAPNSWTRTQRTTRAELIEWLRAYRDAGSFPRNDLFPDRSVPYFRDGRGTLCAMAYLIDRSGRGDLVDRIARTRNNAFIRELADDASLVQWLEGVGLTVAEAARIQPTYGGDFGERYEERVSSRYAFQSLAASGLALATVGANIAAPTRVGAWAGVLGGATAIAVGASGFDEYNAQRFAFANIAIGAVAVISGLAGLRETRASAEAGRSETTSSNVAWAPTVNQSEGRCGLGMTVSARF
jgi:hypothetical protein